MKKNGKLLYFIRTYSSHPLIEPFFGSKERYVPGPRLVPGGRFALGGAGENSRSEREIRAVRMLAGKEATLHLEQCFFTFGSICFRVPRFISKYLALFYAA